MLVGQLCLWHKSTQAYAGANRPRFLLLREDKVGHKKQELLDIKFTKNREYPDGTLGVFIDIAKEGAT